MLTSLNFYIYFFFIYFFYCLVSYKFLSQNQIDRITQFFINKYGYKWKTDDKLVELYAEKVSKWSVGSIFLNNHVFKFSILLFFLTLYQVYDVFGLKNLLYTVILIFVLQFIIGQTFKGKGIQFSSFISLFISLIILVIYSNK
jgi:hypothetical protein